MGLVPEGDYFTWNLWFIQVGDYCPTKLRIGTSRWWFYTTLEIGTSRQLFYTKPGICKVSDYFTRHVIGSQWYMYRWLFYTTLEVCKLGDYFTACLDSDSPFNTDTEGAKEYEIFNNYIGCGSIMKLQNSISFPFLPSASLKCFMARQTFSLCTRLRFCNRGADVKGQRSPVI